MEQNMENMGQMAYTPDQLAWIHEMTTLFSPALTASSSTSAAAAANFKDVGMDMTMGQEFDFSQLLNFDDDLDSGVSSHSPNTISPNHTPSPLATFPSPVAVNPSFELFDDASLGDLAFDFPEIKEAPAAPVAPAVAVKEEPVEFGWTDSAASSSSSSAAPPAAALPAMNFSGLPMDQQVALQQLMINIMSYQSRFGTDGAPAPAASTSAPSGTIQPSLVFSASPSLSIPSSSSSSFVSPAALTNSAPAPASPEQLEDIAEEEEDEPLRSIAEGSRKRSSSVMSFADDLDTKISHLVPVESIFSAGKGKGGKKGGGLSSVVRMEDEDLDDDDSWRPSAEEYKKLSSKEKRQLRNKLSARAFRTRRKDYITTLEGHIKDRDTVIDAMRSELVSSKSENQDLRRELEALKASTMSILHPASASTPSESPALISALAMAPSLPAAPTPAAGPSTLRKSVAPSFNPKKDIPTSFASSKGFFGGANNILGVHTALAANPDAPRPWDLPRQNINPLLNGDDRAAAPSLAALGSKDISNNTFAEWTESNAFSLRSMDSYRMQMWSRLAREAQAEKAGLAQELRPKFYVSPSGPSTSTSTATAEADSSSSAASLAAAGLGHVTGRLAHSFMSAFTGPGGGEWDGDKLAAVVTGRARLHVVNEKATPAEEDDLLAMFGGLKLQTGGSATTRTVGARENPIAAISSLFRLGTPARA